MKSGWIMVMVCAALTACLPKVAVRPTSLKAYNDIESATGPGGQATETVRLTTLGGRLIEVPGTRPIFVTTSAGETLDFYPPLEVEFSDGLMTIRSRYRPPVTFGARDIKLVEVESG